MTCTAQSNAHRSTLLVKRRSRENRSNPQRLGQKAARSLLPVVILPIGLTSYDGDLQSCELDNSRRFCKHPGRKLEPIHNVPPKPTLAGRSSSGNRVERDHLQRPGTGFSVGLCLIFQYLAGSALSSCTLLTVDTLEAIDCWQRVTSWRCFRHNPSVSCRAVTCDEGVLGLHWLVTLRIACLCFAAQPAGHPGSRKSPESFCIGAFSVGTFFGRRTNPAATLADPGSPPRGHSDPRFCP